MNRWQNERGRFSRQGTQLCYQRRSSGGHTLWSFGSIAGWLTQRQFRQGLSMLKCRVVEARSHWWKPQLYRNSSRGKLLRALYSFDNPRNCCHVTRRLDVEGEGRPPTPGGLVTLRVKSETGDEVHPLTLHPPSHASLCTLLPRADVCA